MVSFKGAHFEKDIILTGIRWYVAYPLSYRQLEELMHERGVTVDHSTIHRWVLKYNPQLEAAFRHHKRPVWLSWRLDETYIRVRGQCSGDTYIEQSTNTARPSTSSWPGSGIDRRRCAF
jgi:putative transposase